MFIVETNPTWPICFRMLVGFIKLLHQPTLRLLKQVLKTQVGALNQCFFLPLLQAGTEKTLSHAVFSNHQCDLTVNPVQGFGVD